MTMVQLQSWDRLIHKIVFGTVDDTEDDNGIPTNEFKSLTAPTLCGRWGLTTTQMIQNQGHHHDESFIVVIHHRRNYDGITHAQYNGKLYEVSDINQDPFQNPTAGDLITLTKVTDRDG